MAEEKDNRESVAPIKSFSMPSVNRSGVVRNMQAPSRFNNKRKRKKKGGKTTRGALNLRRVAAGVAIFLVVCTALYIFFNPESVPNVLSGKAFERADTCTVTTTNSTLFFETSCGVYKWDTANLPGAPAQQVAEGSTYIFHSVGFRIPILGVYPDVTAVDPVG